MEHWLPIPLQQVMDGLAAPMIRLDSSQANLARRCAAGQQPHLDLVGWLPSLEV